MHNQLQTQPPIKSIRSIPLPNMETLQLSNGIDVYEISGGKQEVIKMEFVFLAGRPYEKQKLSSRLCASLLKEGTLSRSSNEIATFVDNYGATLRTSSGMDTIQISLYSLSRYLHLILPLLIEVIEEAIFPEEEFEKLVSKSTEKLGVDLEKNDIVAYRELTSLIFGDDHAYGYNSTKETYQNINIDHIKDHYLNTIKSNTFSVFVSGKVGKANHELIINSLNSLDKRSVNHLPDIINSTHGRANLKLDSKNKLQTAIRIGKKLFTRNHQDFGKMFFLSTVLGGYFGSRLMSNIREEKGYTYGIYSSIDSMIHDGYFMISTEVDPAYTDYTILEIEKEILRLQQDLVSIKEVSTVRNYLMGNFLRSMDGPFNVSQIMKTFLLSGLDATNIQHLFEEVLEMTPNVLRDCAITHLDKSTMSHVLVG